MMRTKRSIFALAAVLVLSGTVLFGPAPNAYAILVLEGTITPSAGPAVTIWATDNNVAYPGGAPAGSIQLLDTNAAAGTLSLAPGTIFAGYSVQSSTSFTSKAAGSNDINSSALQIANTTGGIVTTAIAIGDNGFIGPANVAFASASGTWNNAVGSSLSVGFYNDPTNTQPLAGPGFTIPGALIATASKAVTLVSDSFAYSSGPIVVSDSGPYSMTLKFAFSLVNGGTFVSRGQDLLKIQAIPEPATVVMSLTGLPFVALLWSRRRRAG